VHFAKILTKHPVSFLTHSVVLKYNALTELLFYVYMKSWHR